MDRQNTDAPYDLRQTRRIWASVVALLLLVIGDRPAVVLGQQPDWIWSADHKMNDVPEGSCHFRKKIFSLGHRSAEIQIAADDAYEIFVNGKRAGKGEGWDELQSHKISKLLRDGQNLIAIKITNRTGGSAGLAARIRITDKDGRTRDYLTDATWRTKLRPLPLWYLPQYSDRRWKAANSFGAYGKTDRWIVSTEKNRGPNKPISGDKSSDKVEHPQFRVPKGFQIQHVAGGSKAGSLIALTFNEFGEIIVSRENGPLLLVYDSNDNDIPDSIRTYCDSVKNCQGILALSGAVYVTGDGPDGNGLYRLKDLNRDGKLEATETLLRFQGRKGEHGPHGLALGPDGMIYVTVGNHMKPDVAFSDQSPITTVYEGDLFTPRYEDPSGHARGVKAPGGSILRMDTDGRQVELFASGLRNAYDIAFNETGDLFTHDSDMESDSGAPWHRPTRLLHVVSGAEFGWRSGWAKWPDYFLDSLPAILDTGRSSPTGLVFYNHDKFPTRYHNALFTCDWTNGRISAIHVTRNGNVYDARPQVFLEGKPLNVTDICMGPDGWLYFSTGGRGTKGNIYRVLWKGRAPIATHQAPSDIERAITQKQLQSAWGRQSVAEISRSHEKMWESALISAARKSTRPASERIQALQLMHLVGPPHEFSLLNELADDSNAIVRAQVAYYLGVSEYASSRKLLVKLLSDKHALVRRSACEALLRSQDTSDVPFDKLIPLLSGNNRLETFLARRVLEKSGKTDWHGKVLAAGNATLFANAAVAMMVQSPDAERASRIAERAGQLVGDGISGDQFVDVLRAAAVAIHLGKTPIEQLESFSTAIANQFPAKNTRANRELVRLLVYLQNDSIGPRYIAQLSADISDVEKTHLATHLRFLDAGLDSEQKLIVLRYYEKLMSDDGSSRFRGYIENFTRDFLAKLTHAERKLVLRHGDEIPRTALLSFHAFPERIDAQWIPPLISLDQSIRGKSDETFDSLRIATAAALGQTYHEQATGYLRAVYDQQPERRGHIAMALAQQPNDRNWDYLVRSLPLVEDVAAVEVLAALRSVNLAPEETEHYRQAILCGLRLEDQQAKHAVDLLEHWTGKKMSESSDDGKRALAKWQDWFHDEYPDTVKAELPQENGQNRWTYEDLLGFLIGGQGSKGSAERGAAVFKNADCAKCHRHGIVGDSVGPDLSSVGQRFHTKEILQSIVFPSHVISDQYMAKTIVTDDGQALTGLVVPGPAGSVVVLQSDGKKVEIDEDSIDQTMLSRVSNMPEGLLNDLTLEEIADLFAFLKSRSDVEVAEQDDGWTTR